MTASSAPDLLAAVASHDGAGALEAVTRLVFHPHWHIVRLRVLDVAGHVLADVGGPYVIAPVAGVLRSGGRVAGSFVMSVQDDVGVTKLETRFVGDPIAIYVGGRRVASLGASFPLMAAAGARCSCAEASQARWRRHHTVAIAGCAPISGSARIRVPTRKARRRPPASSNPGS